jgi:hypothetical protein
MYIESVAVSVCASDHSGSEGGESVCNLINRRQKSASILTRLTRHQIWLKAVLCHQILVTLLPTTLHRRPSLLFSFPLHDSDFPFLSQRDFFFIPPSTPSNQSCHIALTTARATIAPFYPPCLIQHEQKNRYVCPQPTLRPILEISKLTEYGHDLPMFSFPFLSLANPLNLYQPLITHSPPRRLPLYPCGFRRGVFVQ